MENSSTFGEAVNDFVGGLNSEQRKALRETVLNPQAESDWGWFEMVIEKYHLRSATSPVVRDIHERVSPDPQGIHSLLWAGVGNDEPIHEAITLLNAVRKELEHHPEADPAP